MRLSRLIVVKSNTKERATGCHHRTFEIQESTNPAEVVFKSKNIRNYANGDPFTLASRFLLRSETGHNLTAKSRVGYPLQFSVRWITA